MMNLIDNMRYVRASREVPVEAQKTITGGRLNGMTDINPVWRIYKLTELFGPVGQGWSYEITSERIIPGHEGEQVAITDILLRYKDPITGEWSQPIPGTGGAMFVVKERNGLRTDDEALKKALTDAISVACKALGVGGDIYWQTGRTKYTQPVYAPIICEHCKKPISDVTHNGKVVAAAIIAKKSIDKHGKAYCHSCLEAMAAAKAEEAASATAAAETTATCIECGRSYDPWDPDEARRGFVCPDCLDTDDD